MICDYKVVVLHLPDVFGEFIFENVWFKSFPLSRFLCLTELFNREESYCISFEEDCFEFAATADKLRFLA